MRAGLRTLLLTSSLTCFAWPTLAQTGQPIGSTVVVVKRVTAELAQEARTLQTGDDVRQDEMIEVSNDGRGELKLNDETKLALGPGSRLLLDKFVYDSQQTSGTIVMNMMKGTFRFITGIASKPSYVIRVPNASITVRGTIFDLNVLPNGDVWALLIDGAFRACVDGGPCRLVDQPGTLIRISGGTISQPSRWTQLPGRRNASFDQAFPFVARAPQVDPVPIFTREAILLGHIIKPRRPHGTNDPRPPRQTDTKPTKTKVGRIIKTPKYGRVTRKTVVIKKSVVIRKSTVPRRIQVFPGRRR
jgi:hypothetical protein